MLALKCTSDKYSVPYNSTKESPILDEQESEFPVHRKFKLEKLPLAHFYWKLCLENGSSIQISRCNRLGPQSRLTINNYSVFINAK